MSRIRADAIVNRDANGPVVASEGITIPLNKRISVGGSIGTEGQYLGVTPTGLSWVNLPVSYTLPTATASILGVIRIGTGLSIDAGGVVTATGSGGIADIVSDTTPQLGGNLDTQTFDILGGTSSTIEIRGQSSKLRFHFDNLSDLPSATDWHGMFAHVHATGSAYYAHSSSWVQLAKFSDLLSFASRNQAETFSSLSVNTSVSSGSTLTNSITSLTNTAVNFPNGINTSVLRIADNAGNNGQFLQSTGSGIQWSTQNIVSENSSPTFSAVSITGNLNVTGTITTNNLSTLNIQNSQLVLNDNVSGVPTSNANIIVNRGSSVDTEIRWNELNDRWEFTNDGTTYNTFPLPTDYNNYTNLLNKPSIPAAQVQSDWTAISGIGVILNKPTLFSGSYTDLTNQPNIPTTLQSLNNVSDNVPVTGDVLRWSGTEWAPAVVVSSGGSGGGISGPFTSTNRGIALWNGTTGSALFDSGVTISDTGAITAPKVANVIPFYYPTVAELPNATTNAGAIAYVQSGQALYYAGNSSWTNNRVVTTTSTTTSDISVLIGNLQKTYSTTVLNYTTGNSQQNAERRILRLSDSSGTNSDIIFKSSTGINFAVTNNELTIIGRTYAVSAVAATGTNATFRFSETVESTVTNNDITFVGADGLAVERTNATTFTFRAPAQTVTQYTDNLAKDAAALMLINGTKVGVTYTYDSTNKVLNTTVTGGGGGGGSVITYDLTGRNTTSNNAFIDLIPSDGITDTIEFVGSGGTAVNWDTANKRITLSSVAPVSADWNASSGLAQIQNKPTIPSAYTLPTASSLVLGGVKVGANLTIDAQGVLNANTGSYNLPAATANALGGIKIGSGLTIDGNGVVTAAAGSSVPTIQELSGTTASLAADVTAELNITGYKAYCLFKIQTSAEAWVRIYTDDTSRDADSTRSEGQDPAAGSGVIAEVRTDGVNNMLLISPGIMGFNNDSPRTTTIYASVTNRSISSTTITVTLTALKIGE